MNEQKHKVLIVGVGSIGERHLRCFQATGRAEVSACDVDRQLLRSAKSKYSIHETYSDFDQALSSKHDVAVIATPANLHVPMSCAAAEAGCHLLIEKPLSTSSEGIDRLRQRIAERELTAMVAYVLRSHPSLGAMREAIQSNRFGRALHLYATCGQHFPTYRPAYRDIYYRDYAAGGGAIQDALTHVLNAAQWLVGPIDRLAADAAHQRLEGVDVEDAVNVVARHGSVLASYAYNQHQAPNEFTLTLACEHGTVRFEYHEARWGWMSHPETDWQFEPVKRFERDTVFIRQAHSFLDTVEGKRPPLCSLDEGIETLNVNLAVLRAVRDNAWILLAD